MSRALTAAAMLLFLGPAAACYTTRIHTGVAAVGPSRFAEDKLHHTVVFGIAEASEPVDLEAACPRSTWAEMREEQTFANGVVGALTSSLYTPRTYTIMCAAPLPAAAAPEAEAAGLAKAAPMCPMGAKAGPAAESPAPHDHGGH